MLPEPPLGVRAGVYGLPLFGGRFTSTPNAGFGLSDGGARDSRIGWRFTSAMPSGPGFKVRLDATRREPASGNAPPEYGATLRALIRWQKPKATPRVAWSAFGTM